MKATAIERAAYIAAHSIFTANLDSPELVCPGARRSYAVDQIANIIKGAFGLERVELEKPALVHWRGDRRAPESLQPARKLLRRGAGPALQLMH